jgi:thiosulfate dehydrogenase [quinone] large subunit
MERTSDRNIVQRHVVTIEDAPVEKVLFNDTRLSWLWLIVRLYAGYEWLTAGYEKLISPAWTGAHAGTALTGFIKGALAKVGGAHPDVQSWYAAFLQNAVLPNASFWSYIVAIGETLVGLALIFGFFTGIAAFFGAFMNMNYLLAGTVSTNPILFLLAMFLVLAWKTAGWIGLDRWLLPALGTPWRPGYIFQRPPEKNPVQVFPAP